MRFLAGSVLALCALLAGCSSDPEASSNARTASAELGPDPAKEAGPATDVVVGNNLPDVDTPLLTDSIADASFGDDFDSASTQLIARFGEPTLDSGWYIGCFEPALRVLWWQFGETRDDPLLQAEFHATVIDGVDDTSSLTDDQVQDPTLSSYAVIDTPFGVTPFPGDRLQTPQGLHAGVPIQTLIDVYPNVEFGELGAGGALLYTWQTDEYFGWTSVDETEPGATVVSIVAGDNLSNRPC